MKNLELVYSKEFMDDLAETVEYIKQDSSNCKEKLVTLHGFCHGARDYPNIYWKAQLNMTEERSTIQFESKILKS